MKDKLALVLIGITVGTTPVAASSPNGDARLQTVLVAESDAFMEYWKKGNMGGLADILAPEFIYAGPHGVASRKQALNVIAHCQLTSYSFHDVRMLRLSADSAVLVYGLNQDLTCYGRKDPPATLNSDTFVRRDGKWKIILTTQATLVSE